MARVTSVLKARKDAGSCCRCRKAIKAGDAYKHWSMKTGPRSSITKKLCSSCGLPRPSEMTTSRLGELYAVRENLEAAIAAWDDTTSVSDLADALNEAADEAEAFKDECQSSLDNMPEGLQQGDTGQMLQERIEAVESWCGTLRTAAENLEDFDAKVEQPDDLEQGDDESIDDFQDRVEDVTRAADDERESWIDEQREEAQNACDALEL